MTSVHDPFDVLTTHRPDEPTLETAKPADVATDGGAR